MTAQTTEPTLPKYCESSLDALATSVLASLGVPGEPNPLRLAPTERACLLLIDGLGWELLRAHPAAAPFLSEIAMTAAPLTAGFPATTATSLGSLGTGRPPGQHGIFGYQVAVPGTGKLLNSLTWNAAVDPVTWQPGPTIFERAADAGVRALRVAPKQLDGTGLSTAAMRGADYLPADTLGALVSRAAAALAGQAPAFALVYYGDLDATGHVLGCGSDAWLYQLAHVDKLAEQLASALPRGSVLHVTGDHGMIDVSDADRIDFDAISGLRQGVALLGGEARARHVYCEPGAAGDVIAAWRGVLGERAWVASREQAVADGWFGLVYEAFASRIGDVVVAACGPWAVTASKSEPRESAMVGLHGSLTQSDQLVPLLTVAISLSGGQQDVCPQAATGTAPPSAWLSTDFGRLSTVINRSGASSPGPAGPAESAGSAGLAQTVGPAGPLVSRGELADLLASAIPPVVLDVRWRLGGPPGIDSYLAGHLPGACFIDLDGELSARPGARGRHPLPEVGVFEAAMRRAGLNAGQLAIAYDDGDSTVAARLWWMLRYYGHRRVAVLDGGYHGWAASGMPVTKVTSPPAPGDFVAATAGGMPLLAAAEAGQLARSGFLLDARAAERYRGEVEPIDRVGGHIPGAISAPTRENVGDDGQFLSADELARRFAALGLPRSAESASSDGGAPVIGAYCGSGVTAAHEVLALELAGLPAALYVGSWSEWSFDPSRPVAIGPDPG